MKPLFGRPPADATPAEVEAWAEDFAEHLISQVVEGHAEEGQADALPTSPETVRHLEIPSDTREGGETQS